jgi:branched-chain amino acid transport system permease protein
VSVLLTGLNNGALYALVALGYTLMYGIIELINFAHGDLFMLGTAFSTNFLVDWLDFSSPGATATLALILTFLLTMIFCSLINMSAEFFAYRRLRRAPKPAPLMLAIGLSFVFQNIGLKWNGSTPKQWPSMISTGGVTDGDVLVRWSLIVTVWVTALLLFILTFIVQRTRQGKAARHRAGPGRSPLMGLNVDRSISFTFALAGGAAGAAAVLSVQTLGTTRYDQGFQFGQPTMEKV